MEPKNTIELTALSQKDFLARNNIKSEDWEKAKIPWEKLLAIGIDHNQQADQLDNTANLFAKTIQKIDAVHSVRWRIKNPEHLMAKIVRKRASEDGEKYADISLENYFEIVTDLIGIRALHLFKEDCFAIDAPMRTTWKLQELPIYYLRQGDQSPLEDGAHDGQFVVKIHPAGYRSIHYVFSSQPFGRKIVTEVQVRTIFEEGWSEIDHNIRYPNFSNNQLVAYFLAIFNRMAGSADEMGGFVKGLDKTLENNKRNLDSAIHEKQATLDEMEKILQEFEDLKLQDAESKKLINELKSKVTELSRPEGALGQLYDFEKTLQNLGLGPESLRAARTIAAMNHDNWASKIGSPNLDSSIAAAAGLLKTPKPK